MKISQDEMLRRQKVSHAKMVMTEAMGRVNEELGELYYSEWLSVLQEMQTRLISDLLMDDWRGKDGEGWDENTNQRKTKG